MLEKAQALQEELRRLRRTIHMHPELGFEETKTAGLVSTVLHDLGVEHQMGVGRTGVVARLGNGNGPRIGIRADMDALPIEEANDVPYRSQVPGKMHACGHDAHTTMLMGVAMLLQEESFDGEIRLLFQPSEEQQDDEGISGAMAMIADEAVADLDAVIALHVNGQIERGKIAIDDGYVMANVDRIIAKIIGTGGHGANPHLARDPIFMLAPVLTSLHGIVSRWVDPHQPAVLTVGKVSGGTANNVIPAAVELDMTLRSMDDTVRQQLIDEVEKALSVARTLGGDYEMDVRSGYPATYNDPAVADWLRETTRDLLGAEAAVSRGPVMGAEDFGYMSQANRGAMIFLGTREPGGPDKFVHHPEFDIDETALPLGSAVLAETALRFVRGRYQ